MLNNLNWRHKFDLPNGLQVISLSVTDEKIKATDKRSGDKVVSHSEETMRSKQSPIHQILIEHYFCTKYSFFLVSYRAREEYWQSIHSFIIFTNIYSHDQHGEQEKEQCLMWVKCDMGFI